MLRTCHKTRSSTVVDVSDHRPYTGPWFNIIMPSYQYRISRFGDKTVVNCLISAVGFRILVSWHRYIEPTHWLFSLFLRRVGSGIHSWLLSKLQVIIWTDINEHFWIGRTWHNWKYMTGMITIPPSFPKSKVHGANIGPTWVLSPPGGPHVGPINLAVKVTRCGRWLHFDCVLLSFW